MKQKIEQNKLIFCVINIIAFGIFLRANLITPLSGDDLDYCYIFGKNECVNCLQDV